MPLLIGAALAVAVGLFATLAGLDRDRAFYPTVMIVIAIYYILFGVMGGSDHALALESMVAIGFIALAVVGFRSSLWLVALALALHGIFDLVHASAIANPGVPAWWPEFCLSYDVTAAGYLALMLRSDGYRASSPARAPREGRQGPR
jgi:hypothetical protein